MNQEKVGKFISQCRKEKGLTDVYKRQGQIHDKSTNGTNPLSAANG